MSNIFEYTQSNLLVIPNALFSMRDIEVVYQAGSSAFLYKKLENDLRDIEFYTNTPCFIYIKNGREVVTDSSGDTIELVAGSGLFLPQGRSLQSDYVKETDSLEAYLVFFSDDVVSDFLSRSNQSVNKPDKMVSYYHYDGAVDLTSYFNSVDQSIEDVGYWKVKLIELLYLISAQTNGGILRELIAINKRLPGTRNLLQLLDAMDVCHLSVTDLAKISGKSSSSLNRFFKESFGVTPKKWLLEKKLGKAKDLLKSDDVTVTDISLMLGYENVSAFIHAFKKRYGVTPLKIKKNI